MSHVQTWLWLPAAAARPEGSLAAASDLATPCSRRSTCNGEHSVTAFMMARVDGGRGLVDRQRSSCRSQHLGGSAGEGPRRTARTPRRGGAACGGGAGRPRHLHPQGAARRSHADGAANCSAESSHAIVAVGRRVQVPRISEARSRRSSGPAPRRRRRASWRKRSRWPPGPDDGPGAPRLGQRLQRAFPARPMQAFCQLRRIQALAAA